jgi:predicted extracellular nuclease
MNIDRRGRATLRVALAAAMSVSAGGSAVAADIVFVSDFDNSHLIQWVRRHAYAGGASIVLEPAYVTAFRTSGSGGAFLTMYLEVPPALNGNADYPKRSALKTFGNSSGGLPAVGDCVIVEGVIGRFNGATQIAQATWTLESSSTCGDVPITAFVTPVATVATDIDPVTAGRQPAVTAEPYESVLIRLASPYVLNSNGGVGAFQISDDAAGASGYLSAAQFIYQYNSTASTQLSSVTGVLDEFDTMTEVVYQLLPRSAADIVP